MASTKLSGSSTTNSSGSKPTTNKDLVPIYTDWANHYLEKCHKKRLIHDLQKDMQDSLLLVDVVESVTGHTVPDVKWKPKNQAQVVENIGTCLRFVQSFGANVDGITAKDIRDGQLKAILGLFFSLSRYKQQQKVVASTSKPQPVITAPSIASTSVIPSPAHMSSAANDSKLSRLPSPFKSTNVGVNSASNSSSTGIPSLNNSPARRPNDKIKAESGRNKSPATKSAIPGTPRNSGLKAPSTPSRIQPPKSTSTANSGQVQNPKMLDKFKLFGSKDKSGGSRNAASSSLPKSSTQASNSSSGFSSAKSEASDLPVSSTQSAKAPQSTNSPKAALKAFAKRGLRSPRSPAKFGAKSAKPEPEKVSGSVQTSPQLLRKRPGTATNPKGVGQKSEDIRMSKSSEDTDVDSAYAGFDSSSPVSSNAPSESGKTVSERRSPVGAPSPPVVSHSSQIGASGIRKSSPGSSPVALKPTAAVKGISSSTNSIKPSGLQKPSGMIKPTSLPKTSSSNKLKQSNSNNEMSPNSLKSDVMNKQTQPQQQSPTVGVVSPMTHHRITSAIASNVPPKPLIRGSQESMASGHQSDSNSSTSASGSRDSDSVSVIYCPAASDNQVSAKPPPSMPRKPSCDKLKTSGSAIASRTSSRLETTFDSSDGVVIQSVTDLNSPSGDVADDIKPMEPLVPRTSPYAYFKGINPGPIKHQVPSTQKSHLTLNRQIGSILNNTAVNEGGMEVRSAAGEVSAGYVSDGDALTAALSGPLADLTSTELTSGYMSEGGISLYARKMQARFKEGLEAVRDSMKKQSNGQDMMNDSFEDSSSLSSGISENIDDISTDDLTGSSLSDPQVAAALARDFRPKVVIGSPAHQLLQQQKMRGRRSDSGQQTDGVVSSLQQRRLTEQESIDLLLQKCRTSARGMGSFGAQQQQQQQQQIYSRPKSEQMNGAQMYAATASPRSQIGVYNSQTLNGPIDYRAQQHKLQLSSDGETLRVSASTFGRNRTPLKLVKADGAAMTGSAPSKIMMTRETALQRPGSAQGHSMMESPALSGYHSLDRKRHLVGYYSENEGGYGYGTNPQQHRYENGAAMALVSPRRLPINKECMSLPVSHDGSLVHDQSWINHNNSLTSSNMSRSMIESQDVNTSSSPCVNGSPRNMQPVSPRINGHARLSVPPENITASMLSQSPRVNGIAQRKASHPEGIYANLIQRTSTTNVDLGSPRSSQLQMIKSESDRQPPPSPTALSAPSGQVNHGQYAQLNSPYLSGVLSKIAVNGRGGPEEVHGSSLSLASTSSSIYSTAEEKYQAEIKKLHREVDAYRDKVQTLTAQQSTYTSMVQAFEKALQGMVRRVESLQSASQQKDAEVGELQQKIDILRDLSSSAGINVDYAIRCASPAVQRRHTFADQSNGGLLVRQPSCESVTSTVSQRSSVSNSSKGSKADKASLGGAFSKTKRSWAPNVDKQQIRKSFTRAFSKSRKNENDGLSDVVETESGDRKQKKSSGSINGLPDGEPLDVVELKHELATRESILTNVRLEALSSAHEVDQLKEALNRLRCQNANLKSDNDRMHRASRAGSQTSLPILSDGEYDSVSEYASQALSERNSAHFEEVKDTKRLLVSVCVDYSGDINSISSYDLQTDIIIGPLTIGPKTSWESLDADLIQLFNEYIHKIDPVGNLNLTSGESLIGYSLANTCRSWLDSSPKKSPIQCLNSRDENVKNTMRLALRGVAQDAVDALSFQTLVPKSNLQRYILHLLDQHRLVICGPCGTGKTYLARKLAEFVILKSGQDPRLCPDMIDTIEVSESHEDSQTKLKERLTSTIDKWQKHHRENHSLVLIIDNLHNVAAFSDVFQPLTKLTNGKGPYIIGTMNQSMQISNLQVQHNFRFVLWPNHIDPVKGFLGRYLRRRLIEEECQKGTRCNQEMVRVLEFLQKVWSQLNKFLETANSPDVSIGPRVFLSCPMSLETSRKWFIDLWNTNIHPYLIQAAREGQMYGRRGSLEDPTDYVYNEWPWSDGDLPDTLLRRLSPEDISISSSSDLNVSQRDPLGCCDPYLANPCQGTACVWDCK